jgi:hypothetical protein
MPELKAITPEGITAALEKAVRYRLLNEPQAAESICLDVLAVDPQNAEARVTLVLAITDQFDLAHGELLPNARDAVARLTDPYSLAYYNGIICERWAKALLRRGIPGAADVAYEWIEEAMEFYARAEKIRPAGDDDPLLRWNSCVRLLAANPRLRPRDVEHYEPSFE